MVGFSVLKKYVLKKIRTVTFLLFSLKKILQLHFVENYRKLKRTDNPHEDKYFPVSSMQRNLLVIEKLKNNMEAYNIPTSYHFIGKLDIRKFQYVLTELVKKHESLRTTFHEKGNDWLQKVEKPFPYSIQFFDYSNDDGPQKEMNYKSVYEKLSAKKYSLDQLPLFDVAVFRLSSSEFRVFVNFCHLISDGYSLSLFCHEISKLYNKNNEQITQDTLYHNLQFADYALWERQYVKAFKKEHLDFWESYLKDVKPIELHLMKKNPHEETFQKANMIRHVCGKGLDQKLATFKKKYHISTFHVFLTTFYILMNRLSMQESMTLGFPRANRKHPKLLNVFGLFLNTLLISEKVDSSETFIQLQKRLKQNLNEVYQHESVPYGEIVKHLKPKRFKNRNPYFDILFNYLSNDFRQSMQFENTENTYEEFRSMHSELMLTWFMTFTSFPYDNALTIFVKYSEACFDAVAISQLLKQYEFLLDQVLENPEREIASYSLMCPDENKEELRNLHDEYRKKASLEHYQFDIFTNAMVYFPKPSDPIESTPQPFVPDLISAHANAKPLHPAVEYNGKSWTYKDLLDTSSNICFQLLEKGVQKGDIVGIHGHHSFGLYAAIIATWNVGGVIMMIDPSFPFDYKQEIMKLAGVGLIIDLDKEPPLEFSNRIDLNPEECLPERKRQLTVEHKSDDPAYIFFTSGTTGIPKGIMGSHRGLSHFVNWQKETFSISHRDKCAQITAVTFDVVLRSIFTPLISGATLVIPGINDSIESGNFFNWLDSSCITLLHIVPTLAEVLLYTPPKKPINELRCVFFAGEPLKCHLVNKWRAQVSQNATIVNLYGPTETTLAKAYYIVPQGNCEGVQPIGSPISQTQIYIINQHQQQCGIGEEGEIVIRTPNRSLGYLTNTVQEENRFIQNPFSNDPNDLLYKTGDLGYMFSDGMIYILGRKDDEVKIHGVRVSPHNISIIISKVSGVKQCVVVYKNEKLIAYVVPEADIHTSSEDLKNKIKLFLYEKYPKAYTPHAWVFLDAIPITSRGKVDKRLLPDPEEETVFSEEGKDDLNEVEEELLVFCQETLKLNIKSKFHSIFDAGVDSLDAISFLAYINGEYRVSMNLQDLYNHQTIASIYSWIQEPVRGNQTYQQSIKDLSSHIQLDYKNLDQGRLVSTWDRPKYILVTGSTGFLGSFLLNDLLKAFPSATFYCLIRATGNDHANEKLRDKFSYFNLTQLDDQKHRVIPLLGDLSQPNLGLAQADYDFIIREIDVIYHCGAYVNFLLNFSDLYDSNIEATKQIIKIAFAKKIKPLHYISTAGIFPLSKRYSEKVFLEEEAKHPHDDILYGGYAQSKWVAERIIDLARAHGLPVAVYRPGTVSGDTKTGIWQREDAIASFILGCIELGCFPDIKITLDLAPVNRVSEAIVYISQQSGHLGSIFNMVNLNAVSIPDLMKHINRILDKKIKMVDYAQWRQLLNQAIQAKSHNALLPFAPLFPDSLDKMPRFKYKRHYDCRKFQQAVKPINENGDFFPVVDEKLLSNYLHYLLVLTLG